MTTVAGRTRCVKCEKDKATLRCGGCLQEFCYNHLADHRQELSKQLDEIEANRDLFRQTLTEQTTDQQKHALIQQINDWEHHSIKIIQETAEEARGNLLKHMTEEIDKIERNLNTLTKQLQQSREENDFFETDLKHWNEELTRLTEELTKPSNIDIQQGTIPLIHKINVNIASVSSKQQLNAEEESLIGTSFKELSVGMHPNRSVKQEINILLLGQTGVGRSTVINALANYIAYDILKEAANDRMQAPIPFSFSHTEDHTFEEKQIVYGEEDEYEQIKDRRCTCTQKCRSFVFMVGDRLLRFIDTPPVGDTRGFERDIKNFDEIMNYIARYEYLNGICILLKPDEERLHFCLRYCVSEMLRHLPKNAIGNIMFLFTNARHTFFIPGTTKSILERIFAQYQHEHGVQVLFQKENTFLVDNEAFRYIALYHHGIRLDGEETQDHITSWNRTVKEYARLLAHVTDRPTHTVRDTVSLYQVQRLITILTHSLFQISKHVERAIQRPEEYNKSISRNSQSLSQNDVQILSLNPPRLVCTSSKCLGMTYVDGSPKIEYKSICYQGSYFTVNGITNKNNPNIRACTVMNQKTDICTKCSCSWNAHMVVAYEYRRTPVGFDSRDNRSTAINEISRLDQNAQYILDTLGEQAKIEDVYKKFCKFLQINSIVPFNDASPEFIQFEIRDEQMKNNYGAKNNNLIKHLTMLHSKCENEMNLLKKTLENERCSANQTELIDAEDIFPLVGTLYDLPINGEEIRKQVEELKFNQNKINKREIFVQLPAKAESSQLMLRLKRCMSK